MIRALFVSQIYTQTRSNTSHILKKIFKLIVCPVFSVLIVGQCFCFFGIGSLPPLRDDGATWCEFPEHVNNLMPGLPHTRQPSMLAGLAGFRNTQAPVIKFSIKDIIYMAGPATFKRGEAYFQQNRVRLINPDPRSDRVTAEVQGTERNPYQVVIYAANNMLSADCSCPVGFDCKHGVATALKWQSFLENDRRAIKPPVAQDDRSQRLKTWLAKIPGNRLRLNALATGTHYLLYTLDTEVSELSAGNAQAPQTRVTLQKAYLKANGEWSQFHNFLPDFYSLSWNTPSFLKDEDKAILNLLRGLQTQKSFHLIGEPGALALQHMVATHRMRLASTGKTVTSAAPATIEWQWQENPTQFQLHAALPGISHWRLVAVDPPCYLDESASQLGEIQNPLSGAQLAYLMSMPAVPAADMKQTAVLLRQRLSREQLPLPVEPEVITCDTPRACVTMLSAMSAEGLPLPALQLHFDYGGLPVYLRDPANALGEILQEYKGRHYRVLRNLAMEEQFCDTMHSLQLVLRYELGKWQDVWVPIHRAETHLLAVWQKIVDVDLPLLQAQGWHLEIDADYTLAIDEAVFDVNVSDSAADSAGDGAGTWFDFALSLHVGGENLPTVDAVEAWLEADTPDELLMAIDGKWLRVDTRPLKTLRGLILELFSRKQLDKPARLPAFQAALLQDMPALDDRKAPLTRALVKQLQNFKGLIHIEPPAGLLAALRPYQQDGLNWLTFIQRFGFGGILADDMGLGKTLQALALLLHLKNHGQLNKPALVVCPTSLTSNWLHEALRFTPQLRTCLIQGSKRKQAFVQITTSDLVITTYPLLPRDIKSYADHRFSLLILDEAQLIKNPTTRIATDVRLIKCDTRLCLSGTPLENHLGELWALMDFALPGLLGGRKTFNKQYRSAIEEQRDHDRQRELARRIAPFMLRRTKADVVQDLPPKTEIVQYVELEGKQRTLYESIRISMEKRIRDLIAHKGMARSHIEFLDALLKLRQACIDPRLVKLEKAADIVESAKLNWLSENIPLLLEEGRHILLFSQFTEVLALVEKQLDGQHIAYVKLTGQTRHRQQVIDQFQNGEVRVFLVSLKAGGRGLNLTAADVVIHVDPWWNPAVENQATDRAYRIGQDKPVFVYKLVAANTIEEHIQHMQKQKQALADSLFSDTGAVGLPMEKEALLALLA